MADAWVTPPTFSYGYPASVDDLNIVRNDLLYLYGEIYATAAAMVESEIECRYIVTSEKIAAILYVDHKGDNLYYRARLKSTGTGTNVTLHITYLEDPYGDPADEMGEHTENQVLTVANTYYTFNNGGAAVDTSGWGLSVDSLYQIKVQVTATNNNSNYCYVEVNYMYEEI